MARTRQVQDPELGRQRLDRQTILDAMMQLAREEPQARITFKRLGEVLAVDPTAMYRHFRSKEELSQSALDRLIGWGAAEAQASTGTWRERLDQYLIRLAELCLEHPSIAAEAVGTDPVGPGGAAALEFLLEMLSEAGLAGKSLIDGYSAIAGFALSQCASMAQDVLKNEDVSGDGSALWIGAFSSVNLTDHPLVRENLDGLLAINCMDIYRAGIAKILDAIEVSAAQPNQV